MFVAIAMRKISFSLLVSVVGVFGGWLYLQSIELICYSFLMFMLIGNVAFWSLLTPLAAKLTKVRSFSFSSICRLSITGVGLTIVNQILIYGLVSLFFAILFACESTYSLLQTIQINHFGAHLTAFGFLVIYSNQALLFRKDLSVTNKPSSHIWMKGNGKSEKLAIAEIMAIEADNNTISVHTYHKKFVSYETLSGFLEKIESPEVVRVHKSHAINVRAVRSWRPKPSGDGLIVLEGGKEFRVSRNYKNNLLKDLRV